MTVADPVADIVVGLVAAPGSPAEVAAGLAESLRQDLAEQHSDLRWQVPVVRDALVRPPADDADLVRAARHRLLENEWDLVLCLTDLPLQINGRPVVAHASPVHGVGIISVPSLGAVGVHRRVRQMAGDLIDALVGGDRDRLRELADDDEQGEGLVFTTRVLTGNLRLLGGMVRANRPWRLAAGLSRALTAAVAAGVLALVTSDIWRLADAFGPVRLSALTVVATAAVVVTLVVGGGLWERGRRPGQRRQVALFNIATVATVVIGVASLYVTLFAVAAVLAAALVVPDLLAGGLGHPVGVGDYLQLAWFTSSLATVGGALGAGLESDDAVREAAYTYQGSDEVPPPA